MPQPVAQPSSASTPGTTAKKPLKLKNAALARPMKQTKPEDENNTDQPAGEASSMDQGRRDEGAKDDDTRGAASPVVKDEADKERDETGKGSEPFETRIEGSDGQNNNQRDNANEHWQVQQPSQEVKGSPIAQGVRPRRALNLKPPDNIYNKELMLRIWRVNRTEKHDAVKDLSTNVRPGAGDKGTPLDRKRGPPNRRGDEAPDRKELIGSDFKQTKKKADALKASSTGYKIQQAQNNEERIEREVRSLLNKICPDNLKTIVERLALIELRRAEELQHVIHIIFQKALAEPHYCETYADMVFVLRTRFPEFPAETEGEKAHTFTRVLLNTCQNEFESLPTSFEPTDEERTKLSEQELSLEMKRRKDKTLANMKFIGHLFLRQLLAVKVIGQVVHDLIGIREGQMPEEHMIECVCVLLQAIGHTLDGTTHGKMLMSQFAHRLIDLKRSKKADGTDNFAFSKRIQFSIQDLLDLRQNNWVKKLFKEQAKTKDDIRRDAMREAKQQQRGQDTTFATTTVGVRPQYMDDIKNTKPARANKASESAPKPTWDDRYVKKMVGYYAEDKSKDARERLFAEWMEAVPNTKDGPKQGLEWLTMEAYENLKQEDVIAEVIVELLTRKAYDWRTLSDSIGPTLASFEDLIIDNPRAPEFVSSLLSKLLLQFGNKFNPEFLKAFPDGVDNFKDIYTKALRKVKEKQGTDGVKRALDIREFSEKICKVRRCSHDELRRYLESERLL